MMTATAVPFLAASDTMPGTVCGGAVTMMKSGGAPSEESDGTVSSPSIIA